MINNDELNRAAGALMGLAAGDAVGTTVEFLPRGGFPPVTDMIGGGPFRLEPGQWTDDTTMALCLAESLLVDSDLSPDDLMARFDQWVENGYNSSTGRCFDIGNTTLAALGRFKRTGNPYAGEANARAAGNGSIMRLAPVPIRWWHDSAKAEAISRKQSLTTHAAPEAVDACALLTRIITSAIQGHQRDKALSPQVDPHWQPAIRAIAAGDWRSKKEPDISSTGYVVHTLEAALWAVATTTTFEGAILRAVNLGHDADTVGAVAGQIAGALYGLDAIPQHWVAQLYRGQDLLALANQLFDASLNSTGSAHQPR